MAPNPTRSPGWSRVFLQDLFKSGGKTDNREIARILSAAPEISGEFGIDGECRFPAFDLPGQASGVVGSIPEVAVFVVVIDRHAGEAKP